jgi:hypothetical protein
LAAAGASASDPAEEEYLRLRENSREVVRKSCGECHDGGRSTALPKALAIFDTRDADWARHMTEAQLRSAAVRLAGDLVPTRGKEEAKPMKVSAKERSEFDAYIVAEVGRRAGVGR